jgi:hypothetical protein
MKWLRGYERFLEAQSQFKVQAQNDLEKTIYNYDNNIIDYDVPGILN